jgi:hypothetical protein
MIIVTGLAGSGKTTLTHSLTNHKIIHCDDYRYGENWKKLSYLEYRDAILNAVNESSIIEGAYYDAHDSENARIKVFQELITLYNATVYIIKPKNLVETVSNLIDRSIGRAIGTISQGTCPETSVTRARLIIKNVQYYDINCTHLNEFYDSCIEKNIDVTWKEINN